MSKKHILFVCLGNICRSPAAEAVMVAKLQGTKLDHLFGCDSAGIIGFHAGAKADPRMRKQAQVRGYLVTSLSRQVRPEVDFDRFDLIVAMDDQNVRDLTKLTRSDSDRKKIVKMTDFSSDSRCDFVPDPYYGTIADFDLVLDILEQSCDGLVNFLTAKN